MSQTLVQVGMKFIRQVGILVDVVQLGLAINEFFIETIAMSCFVVSIGNVPNSDRLRTMLATDPVGIGQIDTDSRRRVQIARQDGCGNNLSRYALHLLFLELLINRRMIFEPLCIATDDLGTASSLKVFKINQRFPACLHAQRVAIAFGKAVHKVDT